MAEYPDKRLKSTKELRQFGYSFVLGMAILVLISFWRKFHPGITIAAALSGTFHLILMLIKPALLYPTYRVISTIGKWVGKLLTVVVFTIVYYLLFTPIALILRFLNKDIIAHSSREPAWLDVPAGQNNPERVEKLY